MSAGQTHFSVGHLLSLLLLNTKPSTVWSPIFVHLVEVRITKKKFF